MSQFESYQGQSSSRPIFLGPLQVLGSLFWTVLLLGVYVVVLAWGTVLEKFYGDGGSKFGIYGTWWFNGMAIILAINVSAGLAIKLPWKRSQLAGFVLPHTGLLVLLLGCLISRLFGQETTVAIVEGEDSAVAYKSQQQHIELNGQEHFILEVTDQGKSKEKKIIEIPFTPGPFNWEDYKRNLPWFPWALAHRDSGVLYDRDGIRLEVIDYCSDARAFSVPSVQVTAHALNPDGSPHETNGEEPGPINMDIPTPLSADDGQVPGIERRLPGGQLLRFSMAASKEEMNAFLSASSPKKSDAAEKVTKAKAKADASNDGPARIEILQGVDQKLYMRSWRGGQVTQLGEVRGNNAKIPVFQNTADAMSVQLSDFMPSTTPQVRVQPIAYDHEKETDHQQQVFVRLTVDGQSDEFWLAGLSRDPIQQLMVKKHITALPNPIHRSEGSSRLVVASLEPEAFELGLKIHLKKAWRKLDPGTKQASFYASVINLVPNEEVLGARDSGSRSSDATSSLLGQQDRLITLNAPLDISDPSTGTSYRMFQTKMNGPYQPQQLESDAWEPVYVSYLTLNHDPGRGWTYLGCLMVVAGIFCTYFGKRITV